MGTSNRDKPDRATLRVLARQSEMQKARLTLSPITDELLNERGLSTSQVLERKTIGLVNAQDFGTSRSLAHILRSNLFTLFNAVVGLSFLLLLVLGEWKDALFGFAVVSNILIGVVQEYSSKRTLDRLALLNAPFSRVLRDGETIQIRAEELVLDDLLVLRPGDQITADAVVLTAEGLVVDESLLTGESDPIHKETGDLLMAGAGVVGGSAAVRVTKVGPESYGNQITIEARRYSLVNSELRRGINRVVKWISFLLLPVLGIAINGQMQSVGGWQLALESGSWRQASVGAISGIIAMIPQGLVLITSISFALSAVKLSRRRVLIQELPAVEGLARVDVICFDKTGTLTEGRMAFDSVVEYATESFKDWKVALGHFAHDTDANPTVSSLAESFESIQLNEVARSAFSSSQKWSGFSFRGKAQGTWVLGAPEYLLEGMDKAQALAKAEELAGSGARVLALCHSPQTLNPGTLPASLTPVALILLRERIRIDASDTLRYFAEQSVAVRVISGDHPETVRAVAEAAGLRPVGTAFDGRELPEDLNQLAEVMEQHQIFGRVSPEQKRDMVKALQLRGHVVAMTGDGVNDALALKVADLGIAMGSGAQITKSVSRVVLLDGKFSTLPGVVAEGRRVIANIERISRLFLTKTTWAIGLAVAFGLALWTFPFLPRQLSAIDGFTIGLPAFALALLPNHKRYVPGFLKRSLWFCVPAGLLVATAVLVLSVTARFESWGTTQSQSAVSILLACTGLWVLVTLSRPLTALKYAIIAAMCVMFAGLFFWELPRAFFGLELPSLGIAVVTALVTAPTVIGIELVARFADRQK